MTTLESITPKLKNMARKFAAGDQHEADDIFSEAVLYIIERGFENEAPGFIMQQFKWQALAHIDRANAYDKYVSSLDYEGHMPDTDDEGDDLDWNETVASETLSPEDAFIEGEHGAALAAAVATLDPKAQQILGLLRNDYSFAEIAAKLGVSRSAISQKMNTIQRQLSAAAI